MSDSPEENLEAAIDVGAMTEAELKRAEAAIARQFHGRVPWEMVAWGLGNFAFWLALWPLTILGIIPLWAGFLLATFAVAVCYLPSHEAQHSIIAAEGTKLRWLNELVGYVSLIPLVLPYRLAWITHRMHHAHTNDPELDPDFYTSAPTWWQSIWQGIQARQHGSDSAYTAIASESDDPAIKRAVIEALFQQTAYYAILAIAAWSGYAVEAALLWWIPRHLGMAYIQLFLSWAPHYPADEKGRYRDTRAWRFSLGSILSSGMEFHVIHHLYPKIPLFQTGPAFFELREILEARGIRNDGL